MRDAALLAAALGGASCSLLYENDRRATVDDAAPADGARPLDAMSTVDADVTLAVVNSPANDEEPTLTGNGLELFFYSERSGSGDVYYSTRPALGAPWSEPVALGEPVNLPGSAERDPVVSGDGFTLLFSRDGEIHRTARTAPMSTEFTLPQALDGLSGFRPAWLPQSGDWILLSSAQNSQSYRSESSGSGEAWLTPSPWPDVPTLTPRSAWYSFGAQTLLFDAFDPESERSRLFHSVNCAVGGWTEPSRIDPPMALGWNEQWLFADPWYVAGALFFAARSESGAPSNLYEMSFELPAHDDGVACP